MYKGRVGVKKPEIFAYVLYGWSLMDYTLNSQALAAEASSICSFCSRLKRGRIYAAARRAGYNVLAMGQVRAGAISNNTCATASTNAYIKF